MVVDPSQQEIQINNLIYMSRIYNKRYSFTAD